MAFTRFHDDPARIVRQLQQQTDQGRWAIDVPGNGDKPCFALDPQIIPQKWGANLWTDCTDIQSRLLGLDKRLDRDNIDTSCAKRKDVSSLQTGHPLSYPVCDSFLTTEQSRAIAPAWMARDLPQDHRYILPDDHLNPQRHTEIPFPAYASSRIQEKDGFSRTFACLPNDFGRYSVPVTNKVSSSVCDATANCGHI